MININTLKSPRRKLGCFVFLMTFVLYIQSHRYLRRIYVKDVPMPARPEGGVRMSGCVDVRMCGCADVPMCRCVPIAIGMPMCGCANACPTQRGGCRCADLPWVVFYLQEKYKICGQTVTGLKQKTKAAISCGIGLL
jgi:hypothetical protein